MEHTDPSALQGVADELRARLSQGDAMTYHVPAAWVVPGGEPDGTASRAVNPYAFYLQHVEAILGAPSAQAVPDAPPARLPGDWVRDAVIYNVFVRLTTAYDHDADGVLGTPSAPTPQGRTRNAQGVRESGTFLKCIALLGHARALGATAIHLLPVTAVGAFGNKGALGSPYAIRNPYALEPTLADPLLDADVATQFRAFVEACHRLGMRVITEFVFRTASRDGDWVAEHPEWFYWIRRTVEDRPAGAAPDDPRYYGLPPFGAEDLSLMKEMVARGDFSKLPPPPAWYRELFTVPPAHVEKEGDGRWGGTVADGTRVHVPSAFADWPPDDFQPPWTDVTYLRVYDDPPQGPSFNYIAYNTIRMYDERLARPEHANQPLWEAIRGILPYFQRSFAIDGCMVDMGHALPHDLMDGIVTEARAHHPDFALLSENFTIDDASRRTGYNAVLGYQFRAVESAGEMRRLIERCCLEGLPLPAFGTAETHNTPRVAMRDRGAAFCRAVWLVNCLLPDTIPFIHAGFELAASSPVNLGLAFTPDELAGLSDVPLGLFDLTALPWDGDAALARDFGRIAALRSQNDVLVSGHGPASFAWLDSNDADLVAFRRTHPCTQETLYVVADWRCRGPRVVTLRGFASAVEDVLSGRVFEPEEGVLSLLLDSGEGLLLRPGSSASSGVFPRLGQA